MSQLPGLFVTGTDTGVGKTRIAAAIARHLSAQGHRVGVMKPVATSAEIQPDGTRATLDTVMLNQAIGGFAPADRITPTVFSGDLAPSVAMRFDDRVMNHRELMNATRAAMAWWEERCDVVIVEGVGGLLCPLAEDSTVADLARELDLPLVIVARRGLGTLNHTLLTVEAAQLRGLRITGVVLNGAEPTVNPIAESTNPNELSRWLGRTPILLDLPHCPKGETLSLAMHGVDWIGRTRSPRLSYPAAPS